MRLKEKDKIVYITVKAWLHRKYIDIKSFSLFSRFYMLPVLPLCPSLPIECI